MKLISFFYTLIIFFSFKSIISENCKMKNYKFFLLPLYDESIKMYSGLKKFNYMLILKTEPKGTDKYHLVLNVTFPVNVVIDLSDEILYNFISLEKFCLLDLTKEKGRYVNIYGTISDINTNNAILDKIWIKVENVLLFKNLEYDRKLVYYLLTNYNENDKPSKRYFLMNKMYADMVQNFQIVSAAINKQRDDINTNYVCKNGELKAENELSIGDEISFIDLSDKLRDDNYYTVFVKNNRYLISRVDNFICLKYSLLNYDESC